MKIITSIITDKLEKQQQEIRGIRHDMKNQLIGILGELKMGDTVRAKSEMTRILKESKKQRIFFTVPIREMSMHC